MSKPSLNEGVRAPRPNDTRLIPEIAAHLTGMYGYIPDARGKTDGYQQVYTLPDFRLLFQVSGYGYAVGYTALVDPRQQQGERQMSETWRQN